MFEFPGATLCLYPSMPLWTPSAKTHEHRVLNPWPHSQEQCNQHPNLEGRREKRSWGDGVDSGHLPLNKLFHSRWKEHFSFPIPQDPAHQLPLSSGHSWLWCSQVLLPTSSSLSVLQPASPSLSGAWGSLTLLSSDCVSWSFSFLVLCWKRRRPWTLGAGIAPSFPPWPLGNSVLRACTISSCTFAFMIWNL